MNAHLVMRPSTFYRTRTEEMQNGALYGDAITHLRDSRLLNRTADISNRAHICEAANVLIRAVVAASVYGHCVILDNVSHF